MGGFQLVDYFIEEDIESHDLVKFNSSHSLKLQHSDWRANLVKDFFLQIDFPPMRALEFIESHVIFKLLYNQLYQMKTTIFSLPIFDYHTFYRSCRKEDVCEMCYITNAEKITVAT